MSIYPKKIKLGEPVNFHFRVSNNNSKAIGGRIIIKVKSKNTRTLLSKKVTVKKNSILNCYFRYFPYDSGKHKVTGLFNIKRIRYISKTIKKDYFKVTNAYPNGKDLSYYLHSLRPRESYKDLLEDSERIIRGEKKVKTKIGKIFLSKLENPLAKKLMKVKDYKKIVGAKYD